MGAVVSQDEVGGGQVMVAVKLLLGTFILNLPNHVRLRIHALSLPFQCLQRIHVHFFDLNRQHVHVLPEPVHRVVIR